MALSENEQRILQELESQLRAEDPGLVKRASAFSAVGGPREVVKDALLFVAGFGLLLLLTFSPVLAVVGAGLMIVALVRGARSVSAYARDQVSQVRQKADHRDDG